MNLPSPAHRLNRRPFPALAALVLAYAAAAAPAEGPASASAGSIPGGALGAAAAVPAAAAIPAVPVLPAAPISTASAPAGQAAGATGNPAVPAPAAVTPVEVQGLSRYAAKLVQRGDYPTAEIAYWQILNRPDLAVGDEKTTLLALAHLQRKEEHHTQAAAIYEKFLKDYPNDDRVPEALLDLGRTLRDMGAYKLAISRFYSVINSTLKFSSQAIAPYERLAKTAQFEIAQTHFEAGEYEEAGKYFTRVRLLDLAPADRARATFMAAVSQNLAGSPEVAITTLKTYLDQFPNDENVPEARYLLATTLRQLNRRQEALTVTLDLLRDERSREKKDSRRWSYWQRRTGNQVANDFFQAGDTFNALAIYKGLLDLSPDPSWRLPIDYQIALCYERLRQADAARTAYQAIVTGAAPQAGKPAASEEITELGQMAAWRLAQLGWRDNADRMMNAILPPNEAPPVRPATVPTPPPSPAHSS